MEEVGGGMTEKIMERMNLSRFLGLVVDVNK